MQAVAGWRQGSRLMLDPYGPGGAWLDWLYKAQQGPLQSVQH